MQYYIQSLDRLLRGELTQLEALRKDGLRLPLAGTMLLIAVLGALFGDSSFPSWRPWSGRDVRRSVVHDRLADAGADFMVLSGYEVPEWFADPGVSHERPQGWARDQSFDAQANEHRAVRGGSHARVQRGGLCGPRPDVLGLPQGVGGGSADRARDLRP